HTGPGGAGVVGRGRPPFGGKGGVFPRRDVERRGLERAQVVDGTAVVELPLDAARRVRPEIGRIVAARLERDRLQHLLVVGQRVGAGQGERLGGVVPYRGDAGAGRVGGQQVAVAGERAAG